MNTEITDEELWSLDYTIAKFALPRIMAFRNKVEEKHPVNLDSSEEWMAIIDKMIYALEFCVTNGDKGTAKAMDEFDKEKVNEGFELFGKYFMNLWD